MARAKQIVPAEERGLLEVIHAAPRDDGLRLVYADWLEEHADPDRAVFIRLSVAWEKQHPGLCPGTTHQFGGGEDHLRQLAAANRR